MSAPKPPKRRLKKDDLKTFSRLLVFAKPYWWRLAVGAVTSALGGGSIIALFVVAQQLLSFLVDNHQLMDDDPAPPAFEQVVGAAADPVAPAVPAEAAAVDASVAETAAEAEAAEDPPAAKKGYFDRKARELSSRLLGDKQKDLLLRKGLEGLVDVSLLLLLVIVVNSVCQFLSMYYLQWVGQRVVMDLREAIFAHLQRLSVSFYNSQRAGDMISRTVADTQLLQTTVSNVITDAIRQPLTLLMVLVFVVVIEWKLALFALVLVPTVVVPIVLIGRRLRRISREGQVRLAELTSVMKEALDGVAVVKAFGQEERMEGQFNRLCHGFFRQMIRATKASGRSTSRSRRSAASRWRSSRAAAPRTASSRSSTRRSPSSRRRTPGRSRARSPSSSCAASRSATARNRSSTGSTSRSARARASPSSAPPAAARRPS